MSAEVHQNEFFHNPYASNATKFYDLNDDCVLEIFQKLSVLDLCAIRYTCKRFDALAEYFFKMVYKTLNFSNWNIKGTRWVYEITSIEKMTKKKMFLFCFV